MFEETVAQVREQFGHWKANPRRSYNISQLAQAIFDPEQLEELLNEGLPPGIVDGGPVETAIVRYWKIAPGENAWQWEECRREGFISIGRLPVHWDDTAERAVSEAGWQSTLLELDREKFEALTVSVTGVNPIYSLEDCTRDTGMDIATLERWIRAIRRKQQAIIYGPPGTGKTFMARKIAQHLVGGGDGMVDVVQFHPAYAYEDFIQGIRPQSQDGQLVYSLVPGRFLEFCQEAKLRQEACVLIVDEINRANLARVFGELMYLLEYRDQEIPLAAGDRFRIPGNVFLLGTMNTADRSIALVDHALRRRFAFLALSPNYDLLRSFHEQRQTGFAIDGLIGVLANLNKRIGDLHYEVGISFFLKEDLADCVEDVWRMEIEPYLEEYFYDQPDRIEEFRWEKVAGKITR